MRNMEESREICLCGGEGIHICVACPKRIFLYTFYSNMPFYIPDKILPIQKKKIF